MDAFSSADAISLLIELPVARVFRSHISIGYKVIVRITIILSREWFYAVVAFTCWVGDGWPGAARNNIACECLAIRRYPRALAIIHHGEHKFSTNYEVLILPERGIGMSGF